jgi:hypothetical protein
MYVFLTLFILFLRFCCKNIQLNAYTPSLAHNPPLPCKISVISHQPTSLVAQEHQGHKSARPPMAAEVAVVVRTQNNNPTPTFR